MIEVEDVIKYYGRYIPKVEKAVHPGTNGKHRREEILIGRYYLTRHPDRPHMILIENHKREGLEVPSLVLDAVIKNFWEANQEDIEERP